MAKKKARDYDNDFGSVTEILSVLRKIGLEMWYRVNTPQFINEAMAKGKLIGTQTHDCISQYILTGKAEIQSEYPDQVTNALKSFILFTKENPEIKLTLSEQPLTSKIYGYNGTIDAPCPPILYDWKTTEKKDKDKPPIYDEAKVQTAAYMFLWNENYPSTLIENACIVSLAKDCVCYDKYWMDFKEAKDRFKEVFLPALQIYNYQRRKNV